MSANSRVHESMVYLPGRFEKLRGSRRRGYPRTQTLNRCMFAGMARAYGLSGLRVGFVMPTLALLHRHDFVCTRTRQFPIAASASGNGCSGGTGDDHMKFSWLMRLNKLDPRSLNPRHLAVPDIETEMEKVPRRAMKQYRTPGVPNVRKMLTCGYTKLRFRVDALCEVLKRISPGRNSCFSQTANNSSSIFSSRRASVLPNK